MQSEKQADRAVLDEQKKRAVNSPHAAEVQSVYRSAYFNRQVIRALFKS